MASNASPNVHGARPFGQMVVVPPGAPTSTERWPLLNTVHRRPLPRLRPPWPHPTSLHPFVASPVLPGAVLGTPAAEALVTAVAVARRHGTNMSPSRAGPAQPPLLSRSSSHILSMVPRACCAAASTSSSRHGRTSPSSWRGSHHETNIKTRRPAAKPDRRCS